MHYLPSIQISSSPWFKIYNLKSRISYASPQILLSPEDKNRTYDSTIFPFTPQRSRKHDTDHEIGTMKNIRKSLSQYQSFLSFLLHDHEWDEIYHAWHQSQSGTLHHLSSWWQTSYPDTDHGYHPSAYTTTIILHLRPWTTILILCDDEWSYKS